VNGSGKHSSLLRYKDNHDHNFLVLALKFFCREKEERRGERRESERERERERVRVRKNLKNEAPEIEYKKSTLYYYETI
jgi:hypothetical protein